MNIISISIRRSFLFLVAGFSFFSFLLVVSAQNDDRLPGVTFPIAELGGCDSRESCRTYCDMTEHMSACISFAKKQGLMNEEEVRRAESFSSKLAGGRGPGGCDSPQSCRAYCENLANIETCLSFAQEHDLEGDESKEAKKIVTYLKSGGNMPGGCTSRVSCERYCGDFSHAEECFEFAKKAGLVQGSRGGREGDDMPNEEQFKKLMELAKNGETPGGCTSKESCDAYCRAEGHMEECLSFAEKAGFMDKEKAEKLKKLGGRGPGGCNSEESCHAYCSSPAHQEECFAFAKEHGLVDEEDLEHMRENMSRERRGFESDSFIEDRRRERGNSKRGSMPNMSPEMSTCIKEKLAEAGIQMGNEGFTPEIESVVRSCFEMDGGMSGEARMRTEQNGDMYSGENREMNYGARRDGGMIRQRGMSTEAGGGWIVRLPQEVQACLKEKLGEDFLSVGTAGPSKETEEVLRTCFTQKGERDMGGSQEGDNTRVFPSFPMKGSTTEENRTIERSQPFRQYEGGARSEFNRSPSFERPDPTMYMNQGSMPPYDTRPPMMQGEMPNRYGTPGEGGFMMQGGSPAGYDTMSPHEGQPTTGGEIVR